jgi:transglutaminase-like putative cysteine protease
MSAPNSTFPGYGWIPVDPSDVRRTIALEGISDRDSKLLSLKKVLFGVWEMNWIAFNLGTDIVLPGQEIPDAFPAPAATGILREGNRDGRNRQPSTPSSTRQVEL